MYIVDNWISTMRTQSNVEGKKMIQSWKQKQTLPIHLEMDIISGQLVKNTCSFLCKNNLEEKNGGTTPYKDRSLGERPHYSQVMFIVYYYLCRRLTAQRK